MDFCYGFLSGLIYYKVQLCQAATNTQISGAARASISLRPPDTLWDKLS